MFTPIVWVHASGIEWGLHGGGSVKNIEGRIVFITGASSGIGREMAVQFAAGGAHLGLIARREDRLRELVEELAETGVRMGIAVADVADRGALERAVQNLSEAVGFPDIFIANAGVDGSCSARKIDVDRIEGVLRINLLGALYSFGAVLPGMVERGSGHIVGVSSLAAWRGLPISGAYCASKAGLTAMLESFRLDLKGTGVQVTTIHPGFIRTPMTMRPEHATDPRKSFPMPFLMDLKPAAKLMIRGIAKGRSEVNPPWQLATVMRMVRHFPNWLFDAVFAQRRR